MIHRGRRGRSFLRLHVCWLKADKNCQSFIDAQWMFNLMEKISRIEPLCYVSEEITFHVHILLLVSILDNVLPQTKELTSRVLECALE